jgi:hypothetical protein
LAHMRRWSRRGVVRSHFEAAAAITSKDRKQNVPVVETVVDLEGTWRASLKLMMPLVGPARLEPATRPL